LRISSRTSLVKGAMVLILLRYVKYVKYVKYYPEDHDERYEITEAKAKFV